MEKIVKERRFFYILTLILLAGFLVLPNVSLAAEDEFDDITLRETTKYLELPGDKVQDLIRSFIDIFHSEWENLAGSGYVSAEKMAVPSIMKKAVQVQALNHLLIDAPIEITGKIIKNTVKMTRLFLGQGFGSIFEEIEKESVKRAIGYGMSVLVENEIRMSPGAIEFEYKLKEGGTAKVLIQYIMIYNLSDNKSGEMIVKFYSPNSLKIPQNRQSIGGQWGMYTELAHDLPPFIVNVRGNVQDYKWVGRPSVDIDFPPSVPDLGIKPLSFWEKQILKPIETTIKEVEIIITKVTGKSPGFTDIWNEIKSFISKIRSFSSAGLVETSEGGLENISNILNLQPEKLSPENLIKDELQLNETEIKQEQKPEQELTLEEMQEILDDAAEQIDILARQIDELSRAKLEESAELSQVQEQTEEEVAEDVEKKVEELIGEDEIVEVDPQQTYEEVCWVNINTASVEELQKITGIGPVLAQRIIDARPFYSISDLIRVNGIGKATLQKIINQGCAYVEEIYFGGEGGGGGSSYASPSPEPEEPSPSSTSSTPQILITEVQIASVSSNNDEFIELYNPNNQEVDISSWSIQKSHSTSTVVYKKNFETGNKIPAKGYFLIVYASSTDQNLLNLADFNHKTFNLASDNTIYLVANQEKIENSSDTDIINMVGFGENVFSEGNPASEPQDGESIGREWSSTTQNYIDTDNNQNDFEIQNPTPKTQNQSPQPTENQLPIAQFIYSLVNPIINQEIIFDASSSTDLDGTITSYLWDFGDTTTSTEIKATTTHSYSTSSDFLVSLTVIDNNNATNSATITIAITTPETPTLEVVINEIAWMGTATSSNDEWFELYNNSDQDIDLADWEIRKDGKEFIIFSTSSANSIATTTILAYQYYLLESTNNNTISNIEANFIFKGNLRFNDEGNELELRDKEGNLIDKIGCFKNQAGKCINWFAGDKNLKISMERIFVTTTGTTSTNWASNNLITRNGQDAAGNNINGTPRAKNSVSTSPTTISSLPLDEFPEITLTYLGNPYIIQNNLTIPATSTLKIEPGVILKFNESAGLEVKGTLKAIGEENNKIIFTSSAEPNYWSGIYFTASSINSELIWTEIKYGRWCPGYYCGEPPAILVDNSSIVLANSTVENYTDRGLKLVNSSSTIENVKFLGSGIATSTVGIEIEGGSPKIKNSEIKNNKHGIFIEFLSEGDLSIVEGNKFEGNENPIYALDPNVIFKDNQGEDNQKNGILVFGNISQNLTWFKNDIPYLIENFVIINSGYTLTINPGVIIKGQNVGFYAAYLRIEGKLIAEGTVDNPIVFTSFPDAGSWGGLTFVSGSEGSILKNVIVSYGGIWNPYWEEQGLVSVQDSKVEFDQATIKYGSEAGIYLKNSESIIKNTFLKNNQYGIYIMGTTCPQTENLTFENNQFTSYSWNLICNQQMGLCSDSLCP